MGGYVLEINICAFILFLVYSDVFFLPHMQYFKLSVWQLLLDLYVRHLQK